MFKYVFWFLLFFNGGFLTGGATAPLAPHWLRPWRGHSHWRGSLDGRRISMKERVVASTAKYIKQSALEAAAVEPAERLEWWFSAEAQYSLLEVTSSHMYNKTVWVEHKGTAGKRPRFETLSSPDASRNHYSEIQDYTLLFNIFRNSIYLIFLSLRVHSNWFTLLWFSQPLFLLSISVVIFSYVCILWQI